MKNLLCATGIAENLVVVGGGGGGDWGGGVTKNFTLPTMNMNQYDEL